MCCKVVQFSRAAVARPRAEMDGGDDDDRAWRSPVAGKAYPTAQRLQANRTPPGMGVGRLFSTCVARRLLTQRTGEPPFRRPLLGPVRLPVQLLRVPCRPDHPTWDDGRPGYEWTPTRFAPSFSGITPSVSGGQVPLGDHSCARPLANAQARGNTTELNVHQRPSSNTAL